MASYSLEEQIHSLSLFSNAAFDVKAASVSDLQTLANTIVTNALSDTTIQGCIGNWELVWGPIVWSNNSSAAEVVADNTMMLLYNGDAGSPQFVVAIAGTNAISMYGWFQEDFGVNTTVEWQDIVDKKVNKLFFTPSIAGGTNNGLQVLLTKMQDSNGNSMLQALNNYIQQNSITNAAVAVCGHSLGGALTPVMAMYMQDTLSTWNTAGNVGTITAWPTAGPTPGNSDFATYVQDNMGSNYTSRYNTIDVVPHAWMYSAFEYIPSLYPSITAPESGAPYYTTMGLFTLMANLRCVDGIIRTNYQQIQPWNSMAGTFDTTTDTKAQNEAAVLNVYATGNLAQYQSYFTALYRFLLQMGFQHTTAYNTLLNIATVAAEYTTIKNNATGTTDEERKTQALSTALAKYYGLGRLNPAALAAQREAATENEATPA